MRAGSPFHLSGVHLKRLNIIYIYLLASWSRIFSVVFSFASTSLHAGVTLGVWRHSGHVRASPCIPLLHQTHFFCRKCTWQAVHVELANYGKLLDKDDANAANLAHSSGKQKQSMLLKVVQYRDAAVYLRSTASGPTILTQVGLLHSTLLAVITQRKNSHIMATPT